jgi:hypothetical protein
VTHKCGTVVNAAEGKPGHEWPVCLKCGSLDPVEVCLAGPGHEHDFGDLKL